MNSGTMLKALKNNSVTHWIFVLLFSIYLVVGFSVYRDYGVPIDEYSQIELGRVNYNRIFLGSRELSSNEDRYYGPAFEIILTTFSKFAQPILHIDLMASRHLGIFLYFAVSLVFFYLFLWKLNGNPIYGLIGTILLVLSPRMFAEGFYNSKDIGFLATGIIVLYSLGHIFDFKWKSLLIHGIISGLAVAVRPQAAVFIVASIIAVSAVSLKGRASKLQWIFLYVVITGIFTILFFPIFWDGLVQSLVGFWNRSLNPVGVPTYYFGRFYTSPNIPWHYLVVLVGITSLISVIVTSAIGLILFFYRSFKKYWVLTEKDAIFETMAFVIIGTFVGAIVFKARTYDGWRHIYYIYPSVIGFSVYTLERLVSTAKVKGGIAIVTLISVGVFIFVDCLLSLRFMIYNHPHEYVYFNVFAGGYSNAKKNFDFDYWGISYKQIMDYLMSLPQQKRVKIYFQEPTPYITNEVVPALDAKHFTVVDSPGQADLFVAMNRYTKDPAPSRFAKIFSVSVNGADLSSVYATRQYQHFRDLPI